MLAISAILPLKGYRLTKHLIRSVMSGFVRVAILLQGVAMALWTCRGRYRPPRSSSTCGTDIDGVFADRCAVELFPCVVVYCSRVFVFFDPLQSHISPIRIRKTFGPTQMGPSWRPHGSQMDPSGVPKWIPDGSHWWMS